MTSPRVATGVAVRDGKGRILCIRRAEHALTGASDWAIPGGKLDPGETLESCATRELLEEVGIRATRIVRLSIVTEDMAWGPANHFVTLYYLVTEWEGDPEIMEPAKHTDLRWFEPEEIRRLTGEPSSETPLFEPLEAFTRAGGLDEVDEIARNLRTGDIIDQVRGIISR